MGPTASVPVASVTPLIAFKCVSRSPPGNVIAPVYVSRLFVAGQTLFAKYALCGHTLDASSMDCTIGGFYVSSACV